MFLQYFRPQDADFVKNVFRTFANIPLDMTITASNVVTILTSPDLADLNPRLGQSSLNFGADPAGDCPRTDIQVTAYLDYDNPKLDGYIYICPRAFEWPSIEDIANPPRTAWARNPAGQPSAGYSCGGLGTYDSDWMRTMGSTILREYLHWGFFFNGVPEWYQKIPVDPERTSIRQIRDYKGPNPPSGYGPYNSEQIRILYGNSGQQYPATVNNVENYVYFALSKYWTWRCGRRFDPAPGYFEARRREDSGFRPPF